MTTRKNLPEQVNTHISDIDGNTLYNLLELLDMKMNEVWWVNYPNYNLPLELSITGLEEEKLSFDQVKELYPHWFASEQ